MLTFFPLHSVDFSITPVAQRRLEIHHPTAIMMAENHGLDTQLLTCFLKKRFHDEKPVDIISVDVENAAPKGDNYASMVYRVKMVCLTARGRRKTVSVIVKTELSSEKSKEVFKSFPVFAVETRTYTTILPLMEELMEEFGDKRDKIWADILGYRPYNLIAFEDLAEKGYIGAQRRKTQDFNHSKLVLRNLARFHAMGKVLQERGLLTPDVKGSLLIAKDDTFMVSWWNIIMTVLPDAMVNHWGDEWNDLAENVRKQKGAVIPKLTSLADEYDKRFEVFNHGDLWTCNMLFKYMEFEDDFPVSVKFLDLQLGHLNSFIWDVVYFLSTSTDPTVRRSRVHELLQVYQLSLEKNLRFLKYSGYVPSLEDVESEWKRVEYAQFCFLTFHPFMTANTTTAFDLEKVLTHPPHEVVEAAVYEDGNAEKAIGDDIKNLARIGVI